MWVMYLIPDRHSQHFSLITNHNDVLIIDLAAASHRVGVTKDQEAIRQYNGEGFSELLEWSNWLD